MQSLWHPLSPVTFDSAYVHVRRDVTARKAALWQLGLWKTLFFPRFEGKEDDCDQVCLAYSFAFVFSDIN